MVRDELRPESIDPAASRSAWLAFVGRPILILFAAAVLGASVLAAFIFLKQG